MLFSHDTDISDTTMQIFEAVFSKNSIADSSNHHAYKFHFAALWCRVNSRSLSAGSA